MDRRQRKRRRSVDVGPDDDFLEFQSTDSEDIMCSQLGPDETQPDKSSSDVEILSDDSSFPGSTQRNFNKELYDKCLREYKRMRSLKNKMHMALHGQQVSDRNRSAARCYDGFTRQSVSLFAEAIASLNEDRRNVIRRYGLGSLLLFGKCFVPRAFSTWLASLVEFKSGDLIVHGKVISLTPKSVHQVLGIPLGGSPFPINYSAGKSAVLLKFNKTSLPQVSFFGKKLNDPNLTDEELVMCFLIVALHCFLCPNSNIVPSPRYLGIFQDLEAISSFDWCGFVLRWLLNCVKSFIKGRKDPLKHSASLGGCMYYLATLYLALKFGSII